MSKKSKEQKREIPPWLEAGSKQAVGMAQEIADRPYEAYGEQRFAELDPNELKAIELAETEGGAYRQDLERSRELAERGAQSFLDADIQAYMNPYIESALEPAARELREEGLRTQERLRGQAAMASAFGGSRATMLEAEASGRHVEAISDLYARGYQQAYEAAATAFDQDRVAARASSDQFRDLGAEGQRMLVNEMNNLMVTGGLRRGLEQAGLDFDYAQFVEARDWDVRNLDVLVRTLAGVPHGETITETTKGGEFQAILGAASSVAGAYFMGGFAGGGQDPSSDFRLKDNVELVGHRGEFNWYTWDWNDEAKAIGADKFPSEGVMADELIMTRPDLVGVRDGYLTVDYGRIGHG